MVITFTTILLGLAAFIYPLRRNKFYLLNSAAIIGIAFYLESYHFRTSVFSFKTILLFVVFQLISINITTFFAYWFDKRAAQKGAWRVPERDLHILEFLGGWIGAWIAQRLFRHKISKKSYQVMYKLMIVMEFVAVFFILKFLHLI
ncbi:MAG: DUF1294 domain-containing protein [Alphaproteobacteria bacterium]|nr:DUF1294 domain-containing protein [Alphaproteobacteria bacterium]MBQ7284976.1 DUF1294 domain-containing protein [Alphaproteobacteria bacterium]